MTEQRGRRWSLPATLVGLLVVVIVPLGVAMAMAWRSAPMAAVMIGVALGGGGVFAWLILRRVRALVAATEKLARGDLSARVERPREELGALGRSFNDMAAQLEAQAAALVRTRDELERRVEERADAERAAGREAEAADARKAAVMEASLDAIVLMDARGVVIDWNPAAARLFGWSAQEAMGRLLAEVMVPPALREAHARGLARYLATGEAKVVGRRFEVPAQRRDGSEFPAEVAVVQNALEGATVFTGTIRDVSDRKKAAEAEVLRAAKEAAEAANAELEAFSYSVAHDLRNPLRAIQGFAQLLIEDHFGQLDAEAQKMLGYVSESAIQMAQLIDALLDLARLTRAEVQPAPVDLARLAHAVIAQLRAHDPERTVEVVVEDGLGVHGDAQLLRAMLDNLIGNAWKFTGKTAAARIEIGREEGTAGPIYYVRDNGAGFDMAHASHLFLPFRRMHARGQFEGTGIGLATVHRIVRRHGGKIWAEASVGRGATFRFTLPEKLAS